MQPNSSGGTPYPNFVYLNKPVNLEKRLPEDFLAYNSPFLPTSSTTPRLRDVTNWAPPVFPRRLQYDPEIAARIAQEEKELRLRQEKRRQKALKAMQIAEERRRRLQRLEHVEKLSQDVAAISITNKTHKNQNKSSIFRKSLDDFKRDFPDDQENKSPHISSPAAQSTPITKYTIEELKALRPKN